MLIEGPPGHRQVAPAGRVPPPRGRRRRARAQRARGRARARVPVRRRPPAVRGRRRRPATRSPAPRRAARVVFASPDERHADGGDASLRRAARPLLARAQPRRRAPAAARGRRPALVRPPVAALPRLPGAPARGPARAGHAPACAPATRRPTPRCWPRSPTIPATAHVRPGPLSRGGGRRARRARGSAPSPTRAFREACHRTTGGNPLLVRQLLNALETDARPPGRRARRRRARDRLARRVELRAAAARAAARRGRRPSPARSPCWARARSCPPSPALAGLDEAQVAGAMAALARAEILRPEPPPGFVHPLVRDAVYHGPAARRARAAARARRAACCASAARRWTRSPGQLMHTPAARGRRRSRGCCTRPGNAALARGAVDSSVGYLRRALEEPPPRRRRARGCCSTSARSEALTRGPDGAPAPARGLRRADRRAACASAPRTRSGARCCSPPRPPRAPRVAPRGRRALPPELADEALGAARPSR